ncbi:hypothetical protein [Kordia sp.]|uniref:hypothetical protein n=1 Tax=Kordia sp. TaxID=1965332 RepID=UPI003D27E90A
MKKKRKLDLNKVRVVSLRNLQILKGGAETDISCIQTDTIPDPTSYDVNACGSTSNTYQGGDGGGSFRSGTLPPTQTCSAVLTECELADM